MGSTRSQPDCRPHCPGITPSRPVRPFRGRLGPCPPPDPGGRPRRASARSPSTGSPGPDSSSPSAPAARRSSRRTARRPRPGHLRLRASRPARSGPCRRAAAAAARPRRRARHPGQHQQAVRPAADPALDVGVQPVADDQRPAGARALDRLGVQRRLGLARHHRLLRRWPDEHLTSEPLPGGGRAAVGRVASTLAATYLAPADRQRPPRRAAVADVRRVALNHGERPLGRGRHRPQAPLTQREAQPVAADHQDRRPGGSRPASSRAAAWAEVTTSAAGRARRGR